MKTKLITFKIEDEDRKIITKLQKEYHINISSLIRKFLNDYYQGLIKK